MRLFKRDRSPKVNLNRVGARTRVGVTTDPTDPRLGHGVDDERVEQNEMYLVTDKGEFVRPVRDAYVHDRSLGGCGAVTTMSLSIAETYARNPRFYGSTYCCRCMKHLPVGEHGEFVWDGTSEKVGT